MPNLYTKPISKYLAGTRKLNFLGLRFGDLFVLQYIGRNKHNRTIWLCVCVCGNPHAANSNTLRRGHSKSCGCQKGQYISRSKITHGCSRGKDKDQTSEYQAFMAAKARCENENGDHFHCYGGRGIKFLFTSFEEFLAEVGLRPTDKHSLDRFPDNDGNYEKGNVRWATAEEQQANTSRNVYITARGITQIAKKWSVEVGMNIGTLLGRKHTAKWCDDCTIELPLFSRPGCVHR